MPNAKREKLKKRQVLAKVETVEQSDVLERLRGKELFGSDYPRLFIALQDGSPGELLFIQLNAPVQRRQLPEQLRADGLQRSFAVADFSTFPMGPPPYGVLREFLEDLPPPLPEILFVDGLEHWIDADPETIQALNLGRERLANLGVVVVFLLPAYVINLIRTHALNLWSWRAHYYSLESKTEEVKYEGALPLLDTGHTIAPGDTPEARERRIRILQRLLEEGLAEHRTPNSLLHPIILPLTRELYDAGLFTEALKVVDLVKNEIQRIENQQDKAVALNSRAAILDALGNLQEAEQLFQQSLMIREETLGPNHPEVSTVLNNLAALYRSQGRYAEAETLLERALAIREQTLGPHHPDVAASLNNLAEFYRAHGRFKEAESLFLRSLSIREQALGFDHTDVAQSLNNLALLYGDTGQYAKAQQLHERALQITEKVLGPEHPILAIGLNNLAHIFSAQGNYAEAEALYSQALAIRKKTFGSNHPDVAAILGNLAALYQKEGKYDEAEAFFRESLTILEETLGKNHPTLASNLNNMAALYYVQSRYAEAEPLLRRSLDIFEKIFGPTHPNVALTLKNYIALLHKLGRNVEATMLEARLQTIPAKHAQENRTSQPS